MGLSDAGKHIVISSRPTARTSRSTSRPTTSRSSGGGKKKKTYVSDAQLLAESGGEAIDARTGHIQTKAQVKKATSGGGKVPLLTQDMVLEKFKADTGRDVRKELALRAAPLKDSFGRSVSREPTLLEKTHFQQFGETRKSIEPNYNPYTPPPAIVHADPKHGKPFSYDNPFFSVKGQVERYKNMYYDTPKAALFTDAVGRGKDAASVLKQTTTRVFGGEYTPYATTNNRLLDKTATYMVEKPLETAALLTGAKYIYKGLSAKAGVASKDASVRIVAEKELERQAKTGGIAKIAEITTQVMAVGKGASVGTQEIGRYTTGIRDFTTQQQKDIDEAIYAGLRKSEAKEKDTWGKIKEEISIFGVDREEFNKGLKEELKNKGFTGESYDNAYTTAIKQTNIKGLSEITTLISSSATIEGAGRQTVTEGFKKLGIIKKKDKAVQLFKLGFDKIKGLGIVEGAVQESEIQDIRGQKRDYGKIGVAGGFGGLSAGVFGGSVVALSGTRKGKLLETALNVADYSEWPGDVTQDAAEIITKKTLGYSTPTPVITVTPTLSDYITLGGSKSKPTVTENPTNFILGGGSGKGTIGGGPSGKDGPQVKSIMPSYNEITTFTKVPAVVPSPPVPIKLPPILPRSRSNVPIDPSVPIPIPVPAPVPPPSFVPIPSDTFSSILTKTNTNINTKTNAKANTFINSYTNVHVPVMSPMLKIPPFPAPVGGGGGGGFGRRKKKKKKGSMQFAPSLAAVVLGIKGKKPKLLTGLNVRPIPL